MTHSDPFPNLHSTLWLSCTCFFQVTWQVHNHEYSHTSAFIWKTYGTIYLSGSIHLGSFNVRHKYWLHKRLWLTCKWGEHCGHCTSISWSELEESWEIIEVSWLTLVSITQAKFFVALGILGLWKLDHRPLPSRYNKIKQYISIIINRQACKAANHCNDTGNTGFHMERLWELYSSLWDSGYWDLRPLPHETWKVLTCASCKQP